MTITYLKHAVFLIVFPTQMLFITFSEPLKNFAWYFLHPFTFLPIARENDSKSDLILLINLEALLLKVLYIFML